MNKRAPHSDPRIFDYLIGRLLFWKDNAYPVNDKEISASKISGAYDSSESGINGIDREGERQSKKRKGLFIAALSFLFIGQIIIEWSFAKTFWFSGFLFLISLSGLFILFIREQSESKVFYSISSEKVSLFNWLALGGAFVISLFNFFLWKNSGFGWLQVFVWLVSVTLMGYAITLPPKIEDHDDNEKKFSPGERFKLPSLPIRLGDRSYLIVLIVVIVIVLLFQILFIFKTPVELVSQQVETFLAVDEILAGSKALLFPRNVVSEPLGYYSYAFFGLLFPEGMRITAFHVASMLSFCIGLFFLFRLTKLLFDKWVAVASVFLFGIGFWPILQNIALIGNSLVFPLLVGALFFLFRGLQKEQRLDLFIFGLISGLGLFANKLFLIMPFVSLIVILIWWIADKKHKSFLRASAWFGLSVLTMLVFALPLIATVSVNPAVYFEPILSRVSQFELAFVENPLVIFIKNFFMALGMVNFTNNSAWVDGIAKRPALDAISAVFFLVGLVWSVTRWRKEKQWHWLAIPVLWMIFVIPSAMSLAFPQENPSLSRAYGAAVPVFMLSGEGLVVLIRRIHASQKVRIMLVTFIAVITLFFNYQLLHGTYVGHYRTNAWNTREMSEMVLKFERDYGKNAQAWIVSHPHWVDERAVAILAGKNSESLRLDINMVDTLDKKKASQLFILNIEAIESLNHIKELFPNGVESIAQSELAGKDFRIYLVPEK